MTPHPDTATTSTSILEALKKMHGKRVLWFFLFLRKLSLTRENVCGGNKGNEKERRGFLFYFYNT